MDIHPEAAVGFARGADDYERTRPSYPADAVAHLVSSFDIRAGATVVDVAAGTGKLTRLLLPTGARVIAVEPVAEMRSYLASTSPDAEVLEGVAEHLPVADGTADAITVAQAIHWFDRPAALASFARVLRPGGGLGIINNERLRGHGWMAEADDLMEAYRGGTPQHYDGVWQEAFAATSLFGPLEEAEFDNPQVLSPDSFIARLRSVSYVGALDRVTQDALLTSVAKLLASHPDTAGKTELLVPQSTRVWICRRT